MCAPTCIIHQLKVQASQVSASPDLKPVGLPNKAIFWFVNFTLYSQMFILWYAKSLHNKGHFWLVISVRINA